MRWWCPRLHAVPLCESYGYTARRGDYFPTFRALLWDQVVHHPRLNSWLIRVGFIDAKSEGGDVFWRWDFWNAWYASKLRAIGRSARR